MTVCSKSRHFRIQTATSKPLFTHRKFGGKHLVQIDKPIIYQAKKTTYAKQAGRCLRKWVQESAPDGHSNCSVQPETQKWSHRRMRIPVILSLQGQFW